MTESLAAREMPTATAARTLPEEVAVALTYQGSTQAVMMASPSDVHDFAIGFSLSEGLIDSPREIESLDIVPHPQGFEARLWLSAPRAEAMTARRRRSMGPVGCGLCGIDSLDAALRPLPDRGDVALSMPQSALIGAANALRDQQPLQDATRACHAAAFVAPDGDITCLREDVGRHNALDKLIGALVRAGVDPATGAVMMTSRLSVDMVQKTAIAGAPVLCAVSAPTVLAVQHAQAAGLTLACLSRAQKDRLAIFTRPDRITP